MARGSAVKEVPTTSAAAYAAPLVGSFFFYMPMWGILPGVYAKYFGLELTALAAVLLFIRVFDGFADLSVGLLSDWHRAKGGSRKTWVVIGGLGSILACAFLFTPPADVTPTYYLVWSLIYFVALTMSELPHQAWGSELTLNYQTRARVFGFRSVGIQIGVACFFALPLLPMYNSTDYTPLVFRDAVYVGAGLTLLGLVWAVWAVPRGIALNTDKPSFKSLVKAITRNRPLHSLAIAGVLAGLGSGMNTSLAYVYVDGYLGLGPQFALISFASIVWAICSTPLWLRLIQRTNKAVAWFAGACIYIGYLTCMLFVEPHQVWATALLMVLVSTLYSTIANVAGGSIMGDVVDYGKLRFNRDYGATYYAFNTALFKVTVGIGAALGFGIAGLFHFNPADAEHSAESILGLKLAFVIVPALFMLASLPFILRSPLTPARQRIIQLRLEARAIRDSAPNRAGLSSILSPKTMSP
jgi:Na+/melibiose symporter-like transporter